MKDLTDAYGPHPPPAQAFIDLAELLSRSLSRAEPPAIAVKQASHPSDHVPGAALTGKNDHPKSGPKKSGPKESKKRAAG